MSISAHWWHIDDNIQDLRQWGDHDGWPFWQHVGIIVVDFMGKPWKNQRRMVVLWDLMDDLPSGNDQHSYWKWPFIASFPIKTGDFPLLRKFTRGYWLFLWTLPKRNSWIVDCAYSSWSVLKFGSPGRNVSFAVSQFEQRKAMKARRPPKNFRKGSEFGVQRFPKIGVP